MTHPTSVIRVFALCLALSPCVVPVGARGDTLTEVDAGDTVLDGYRRALAGWVAPERRAAIERISTMGTGPASSRRLSRMLRYELFRRVGGPAILATGIPQLRAHGREISRLPPRPHMDWDAAMSARMNLDSAFNVVGDLRRTSTADQLRHATASSAVSATWNFLREFNAETMAFDGSDGLMLGNGEVSRTPPRLLSSTLEDASRALPRARVRRIAVAILRAMIADAHRQVRSGVGPPD